MENLNKPVKYFAIQLDGYYRVYVRYETGEEKFICKVQSKELAERLVKEFNSDIKV